MNRGNKCALEISRHGTIKMMAHLRDRQTAETDGGKTYLTGPSTAVLISYPPDRPRSALPVPRRVTASRQSASPLGPRPSLARHGSTSFLSLTRYPAPSPKTRSHLLPHPPHLPPTTTTPSPLTNPRLPSTHPLFGGH